MTSTPRKETARLISVPNCANCPFSYSPDDDDEWTCTATENNDGLFKTIKRLQKRRGGPSAARVCVRRGELRPETSGGSGPASHAAAVQNCSPSRLDIKRAELPSPTVSDG